MNKTIYVMFHTFYLKMKGFVDSFDLIENFYFVSFSKLACF